MKEEQKQDQSEVRARRPVERIINAMTPARSIALVPEKLKPSKFHSCGEQRVKSMLGKSDVSSEAVATLTQRCYELAPGGHTKLRIEFTDGKERVHPQGLLELAVDRGKLSKTRMELTGKEKEIVVEYTAPDETIRISIRAFLDGFARGKIHLHLEP